MAVRFIKKGFSVCNWHSKLKHELFHRKDNSAHLISHLMCGEDSGYSVRKFVLSIQSLLLAEAGNRNCSLKGGQKRLFTVFFCKHFLHEENVIHDAMNTLALHITMPLCLSGHILRLQFLLLAITENPVMQKDGFSVTNPSEMCG